MEDKNTKGKSCLNCGDLFIPERSTKKYCSDACKQTAFYQRAALHNIQETETSAQMPANTACVSPEREHPASYNLPINDILPLNGSLDRLKADFSGGKEDSIDLQKNLNIPQSLRDDNELPLNVNADKTVFVPGSVEKYEAVGSSFIDAIATAVDEADKITGMLMYPPARWTLRQSEAVKNNNIRLRCLIENLLALNRQPLIPRRLIKDVSIAFAAMGVSPSFKSLPPEYPYKELIGKLGQQCGAVSASMKKVSDFKLRLAIKSKVELISTRFIISSVTPLVSFHDLDFTV